MRLQAARLATRGSELIPGDRLEVKGRAKTASIGEDELKTNNSAHSRRLISMPIQRRPPSKRKSGRERSGGQRVSKSGLEGTWSDVQPMCSLILKGGRVLSSHL
jgi:hypothetical protein